MVDGEPGCARKESEGKIYTGDNISGRYFAGRSATTTQRRREGKKERREWLIFGIRGRSYLAGLKNVLLLIYTLF